MKNTQNAELIQSFERDNTLQLWILRLFFRLGAHKQFMTQHGFNNQPLAGYLNLTKYEDEEFNHQLQQSILGVLRLRHAELERQIPMAKPTEFQQALDSLARRIGLSPAESLILEFTLQLHQEQLLDDTADYLGAMTSAKVYRALAAVLDLTEDDVRFALGPLGKLEEQLQRVDSLQQGQLHLDRIFSNWSAGRYAALPLAGRCYVALEELRWGAFGDVIRQAEAKQAEQFIEMLKNRALTQMALDFGTKPNARHDVRNWLAWQAGAVQDTAWPAVINWMANWCKEESHPISWAVTQSYETLPIRMPRICSAERIADAMVDEVFSEDLK